MFSEYFNPVNIEIIDYADNLDNNQLGSKLKINGRDNLNFFDDLDVVIFSINEYRFNSSIQKSFNANKDFRKKLYSLYYGNWDLNIYDFGDLENGNLVSDTQFALSKILEFFSKNKILVNWESDQITIEKGRWGKIYVIKGKKEFQYLKTLTLLKYLSVMQRIF